MSEENEGFWSEEQIKEWEHDRWLNMQEMGGDIYDSDFNKDDKDNEEMEGDPFEEEERRRWQKEEEEAKEAYFQMIKGEEERGYFRKTVSELIEEESEAKKIMKKMQKEKEEKEANAEKPETCEDEA